jgi:uncharacterized protein
MEFDTFTAVLLESRPNAPHLDEKDADALQDAHMAYLATLHEQGRLQAAGPLLVAPDDPLRGLCLLRAPVHEADALFANDPAVRAGRLTARTIPWMVPKGAVAFSPARFPHAQSEL